MGLGPFARLACPIMQTADAFSSVGAGRLSKHLVDQAGLLASSASGTCHDPLHARFAYIACRNHFA